MNKIFALIIILAFALSANAAVVSGSATVRVHGDNVKQADISARNSALVSALYNYFSKQQESENAEIPEITSEYFKFIKSYKITERHYSKGTVTYSVIADIDKVSLGDVAYMIKNVTSTAVFVVRNTDNSSVDDKIADALKKNQFSTRYQSDFRASVSVSPSQQELTDAFMNSRAQYLFDITADFVSSGNTCTAGLSARVISKEKEYSPIKINGESSSPSAGDCQAQAAGEAMTKLIAFVRENYIPLPDRIRELVKATVIASNYSNFAAPKNIMEDMRKRTFITGYAVKGFAEKSLEMEAEMYISADMLVKKLQMLEKQYGFKVSKNESGYIVLDFTSQE